MESLSTIEIVYQEMGWSYYQEGMWVCTEALGGHSAEPALFGDSLPIRWLLTLLSTIVLITSNLKLIPGLLSPKVESLEKDSMYECGFEPFEEDEEASESHFILIGVLFVLFDLELVLLVPMLGSIGTLGGVGIILVVFFLLILVAGLIYE